MILKWVFTGLLTVTPLLTEEAVCAENLSRTPIIVTKGVFSSAEDFRRLSEVDEFFEKAGYSVYFADTPRGETIEFRGESLKREIQRLVPQGKYHLLAISMGGLDARYALATAPHLKDRCSSLVTIASPHHGSPVATIAQFLLGWIPPRILEKWPPESENTPLLVRLLRATPVLTPSYVQGVFNRRYPEPTDLPHASLSTQIWDKWIPFDGLVTEASARFGEHLGIIESDHLRAVFASSSPHRADLAAWSKILTYYRRLD